MSFLRRSVLALRTLLWVLLGSLLVFMVATGLGFMHERNRRLQDAHADVQRAVDSNIGAISVALWSYDMLSLSTLLRGMTQSGALVKIDIQDERTEVASASRPGAQNAIDRQWSVPLLAPDGKKKIGTLNLAESYDEVYRHLEEATITLVVTQLIEVIGLAFILFVIVYRQIARHLHRLADEVVALGPADQEAKVGIDRRRIHHDELDTLVDSINRFLHDRREEMGKRSRAEASLREHMAEMEAILGALSDGVIALDEQCRVRYANDAARTFVGAYDRPIDGMLLGDLLKVVTDLERELDSLCHTVLVKGIPLHMRGNVRIRPTHGAEFDAKISAVPAQGSGEVAMILVFTDISAEIGKERQIEFQAFHDPLTRLGNRSLLTRDLARDIERASRSGSRLAVLCLDLDNFKNINDALGHGIGDVLLRQLAQRLQSLVAGLAWITRHGGDEFIVVIPAIGEGVEPATLAERLMADIAKPFHIEQHELRVTSSIGISLYPDHGSTIAELVSNADMAMYEAKRDSRNTYRFYELGLLHRSAERLSMENGLRVALAEEQFVLVFQPKTVIASAQIESLEALLRWPGAPGGPISPAVFIPVAEDTGMIIEIGDWVLRESLAAARRLRDALGHALPIAVNVSPIQFRSDRLFNTLDWLASIEPDLAQLLELELTESALSGNIPEVIGKLDRLKAFGLKIAIDDFGTGYSSLAYLKNFPIDILKIDQAFIRDLHTNAQDQAIVGSVVQLGKSLGFTIVAEGVEEEAHVAILRDLGCDIAQGYWYARPMPEADILARYGKK